MSYMKKGDDSTLSCQMKQPYGNTAGSAGTRLSMAANSLAHTCKRIHVATEPYMLNLWQNIWPIEQSRTRTFSLQAAYDVYDAVHIW